MCYETVDSNALSSEPYLNAVNHPSSWTREAISHSKNIVRAIYRMDASCGKKPPMEAPYIVLLKFNVEPSHEAEFLRWYRGEQLRAVCRMPGVHRGRLYKVDQEISLIKTEERKIHGGGPAHQAYLTLGEIASLDVPLRKDWQDFQKDIASGNGLKDIRFESYWLDFVMYAPVSDR